MCSQSFSSVRLCGSMNYSPLSLMGVSVHGILRAGIQEWVAISYPRGSSQPRDRSHSSCVTCIGRHALCHCTTCEALKFSDTYIVTHRGVVTLTHSLMVLQPVGWNACLEHRARLSSDKIGRGKYCVPKRWYLCV